tara:strand:+ start:6158 stop:6421 length:264 start_codon:yes stop_codon:yes gene_type:complete
MFDPEDLEDGEPTLKEMYDMYLSMCNLFIEGQGKSPMEVAAILQCIATSLYKSCLSTQDFEKIMKHMYDSRNLVEHMVYRPENERIH